MLTRLAAAAVLAILVVSPALAQTTSTPAQTTTGTPPAGTATRMDDRGDSFDWGLLGLLGLAGLAPLFMRKDRQGNVHADTRR